MKVLDVRPRRLVQRPVDIAQHPWVLQQHRRLRTRWDLMCPILGAVGRGKSTLALHLAQALDPSFIQVVDGEIVFPRLCFSTAEVERAADEASKFQAIVLDEATDGAMAMEWQRADNRSFTKYAIKARKKHLALFIAVPDLDLLLKFIRGSRSEWIWWLERRGLAHAYYGEKGLWQSEMFRQWQNQIRFPQLPKPIEKAYLRACDDAERRLRADVDETETPTLDAVAFDAAAIRGALATTGALVRRHDPLHIITPANTVEALGHVRRLLKPRPFRNQARPHARRL